MLNRWRSEKLKRRVGVRVGRVRSELGHVEWGNSSKVRSKFRWPLGRVPTVGEATMAIAEPSLQIFF